MKTIELSAKQRQEIQERRRLAGDRRIFQRLSTLLWIDEGRTREEVADLLGVTSRQVGDWLRIFRNKGLEFLINGRPLQDPIRRSTNQLHADPQRTRSVGQTSPVGVRRSVAHRTRCAERPGRGAPD